jgi:hypothetical protein
LQWYPFKHQLRLSCHSFRMPMLPYFYALHFTRLLFFQIVLKLRCERLYAWRLTATNSDIIFNITTNLSRTAPRLSQLHTQWARRKFPRGLKTISTWSWSSN